MASNMFPVGSFCHASRTLDELGAYAKMALVAAELIAAGADGWHINRAVAVGILV